jgi:hypothetical protein
MRSIGTSVSSAVIGMVLANTAQHAGSVAVPTMHGFRVSFLIATAAVVVGLLLAVALPARKKTAGRQQIRVSGEASSELGDESATGQAVLPAVVANDGFHGRVVDVAGAPVTRATITLIDSRGRKAGSTLSDDEGYFALTAPADGHYVLSARAAGHAPHATSASFLTEDQPVEVDLRLPVVSAVPAFSVPESRTVARR